MSPPAGTQLSPELVASAQELAGMGPAPLRSSSRARPGSWCQTGRKRFIYWCYFQPDGSLSQPGMGAAPW